MFYSSTRHFYNVSKEKLGAVKFSSNRLIFPFGKLLDFTLSWIRLTRPSFPTNSHQVSEPQPYSIITSLGRWLRVFHYPFGISQQFLPVFLFCCICLAF